MAYQGQFTGDVQLPITSAILKTDSSGKILAAVAGVDYLTGGALSGYLPLTGGTLTGPLGGTSASFSSSVTATDLRYINNGYLTYDVAATGTNTMQIRSGYAGAVLSFSGIGAATFSAVAASPTLSGGGGYAVFKQSGGYANVAIGGLASGSYAGWIQSSDGVGTSLPLSINPSGGNVGIGTTTDAGYKLDVNGTGRFSGVLRVDGNTDPNSGAAAFFWNQPYLGPTISGFNFEVRTGNTGSQARRLFINETGAATFEGSSVNVGTIYNYSTLNILASSSPALTITDGYNGKFTFIPYENTTNGHLIRSTNYADNAFYPLTLAASRVQAPNGSLVVGGTNDNGYAFYTNGAGKFTGDLTSNTLKTAAPSGSTAQPWKLGNASTGTCVPTLGGGFTSWFTGTVITIEINGSTYTIPVVVSNYC